MRYLLDTNVCVDYLRGRHPPLTRRIQRVTPEELCVSSVVVAELRYGAERSSRPQEHRAQLDVFLHDVRCISFDSDAAAVYGRVRVALEKKGVVIGPYDLQIAAHALSLGLVLVTDNVREFRRVTGLRVENWRARTAARGRPSRRFVRGPSPGYG